MGRTRIGFTQAYAQSLSANCDLDLWPSNIVLTWDTSSCHDDHLWQIIFKTPHAGQRYGPDMILEYTNKQTHKHGQGRLYMPFRHFMEGCFKSRWHCLKILEKMILPSELLLKAGKIINSIILTTALSWPRPETRILTKIHSVCRNQQGNGNEAEK